MRVRSKARSSKRKFEIDSGSAYESRPKRTSNPNEGEDKVDRYCWVCHTEANEEICIACHRAYHNSCLNKTSTSFSEQRACAECQSKTVNGTEFVNHRYLHLDKLKIILDVLTRRSFGKKKGINEKFVRWPEDCRDKLFKIIDFEILLDKINHGGPPYLNTADFFGDVKFLYHNACIVYGANSDDAKVAENLRREFKSELLDLEACPECYYYLYCDESDQDPFVRLCDSPHDIVWARLTGHPFWPAKCLKVVKDIAHVRFFGEHEQSNIPINKCYCLSKCHPKEKYPNSDVLNHSGSISKVFSKSGPKTKRYKSAVLELEKYINLYEEKYGNFQLYPHKTSYKPHEKIKETNALSTEGTSCRNGAEMKSEGFVNEDSDNHINAAAVEECSEDSLTYDITSPNGNLNTNSSAVTSINMTFSADENLLSIDNVNAVASSLEPLSSIASTSGTETVHKTLLPSAAANDASNDSSVHIDSLNIPICTENHSEVDDDVHFIEQSRNEEADESFNPDIVLPIIMEENPDLKALVQKARYLSDGMIIHLWANLCKQSSHVGAMSKLAVQLRKCKSKMDSLEAENNSLKADNNLLKLECHRYKEISQDQETHFQNLTAKIESLNEKIQVESKKNADAANNAKTIIRSLKSGCSKRIEEMLRAQFLNIIQEKEDIISKTEEELQNEKNKVKNMEEERKQMEEEKRQMEAEKRQMEAERRRIEAERRRIEEERRQMEEERRQMEEVREQMEEEREQMEEVREQMEEERKQMEEEKRQMEAEKRQMEAERRRIEAERRRIEEERRQMEEERRQMEEERRQMEEVREQMEEEREQMEEEREQMEEERKQMEEEKKQMEEEKKQMEEEREQLTEELENFKQGNNSVSRREIFTPELVREYKILHFCCVCEKKASFVCCLNASYCSSGCQSMHAQYHQKFCSKKELSRICKRTVKQQIKATTYVQQTGVITTVQTNTSTNPDASDSRTITSFTHHKKAEIQRVAGTNFCPSPPANSPGFSSPSNSSKSRRR